MLSHNNMRWLLTMRWLPGVVGSDTNVQPQHQYKRSGIGGTRRRMKGADRILMLLLVFSFGINVLMVGSLFQRQRASGGHDVKVGAILPAIRGITTSGETRDVEFESLTRPLVLYVFSESCVWCQRNEPSIRQLFNSAVGRFDFMAISLGGANASALDDLGIVFPSLEPKTNVPFRSTPQTVVVGKGGEVLRAWNGAYVGPNKASIEEYFAVSLPALAR